jgi:hypothetical protein
VSAETLIVPVGQALVGWAMATPTGWLRTRSHRWRGLRGHALILGASFGVGLASIVAAQSLGWLAPVAHPVTRCDQVLPVRECRR